MPRATAKPSFASTSSPPRLPDRAEADPVFAAYGRPAASPRPADPEPVTFDFEAEPEPPDYLVERLIERATVNILSGDTGTGKSWIASALAVAIVRGEDWLGRSVYGNRVLIVDEENPRRAVSARLRALGMTNAELDRLAYYNRNGIQLGAPAWSAWLAAAVERHQPDLVVIDTATAATNVEVNDNDLVVRLYQTLRPLAEQAELAVLLLHHERKPQAGQSRAPGQAMLGARQWAGQADAHLTLTSQAAVSQDEGDDGRRRLKRSSVMRLPLARDGEPDIAETIEIESEKDADGRLVWATVSAGGPPTRPLSKVERLMGRMAETLADRGEMRAGELAKLLDEKQNGSSWTQARKRALEDGLIRQVRHGVLAAGAPAI